MSSPFIGAAMLATLALNPSEPQSAHNPQGYTIFPIECNSHYCHTWQGEFIGTLEETAAELPPIEEIHAKDTDWTCHLVCYDPQGNLVGREPK